MFILLPNSRYIPRCEPRNSLPAMRLIPLFLLSLLPFLSSCSRDQQTLIIGTDATYPPFEFKDEAGNYSGVSIDMGKALAEQLGRPVEFKNMAFDGLIPALQTQSVDIIISSMTASAERRKTLDFSDPYANTCICMLVPKDSPLKSGEELKQGKRRVVAKIATTGEQWAKQHLPNSEVVALDSDPACVMEVSRGGADAWIYDQISVMGYAERNPDTTRAELRPINVEHWAIALRQGQPELREQINAFLKSYRARGGFDALAEKYLAKQRAQMKAAGIPFLFDVEK
jgi:polar amino acid transport system substrate-binding protein